MNNSTTSLGFCVDCRREMASSRFYRALGLAEHHSHSRCRRCHDRAQKPGLPWRDGLNWQTHAACRRPGVRPDWWFPERSDAVTARNAKNIYRNSCPVREQCLNDALATEDNNFGIRGGLTPDERRRMPRRRRTA